jgi:hypothetical protein
MEVGGQHNDPAALSPAEEPQSSIVEEAGWVPVWAWTLRSTEKSLSPAGNRILAFHPLARSYPAWTVAIIWALKISVRRWKLRLHDRSNKKSTISPCSEQIQACGITEPSFPRMARFVSCLLFVVFYSEDGGSTFLWWMQEVIWLPCFVGCLFLWVLYFYLQNVRMKMEVAGSPKRR